ncbi:MAG: HRDC domain-containing protein [Methylotenera sp.]|nr:HRDC domain-containing protein [Oligoflexia bacterium]
MSAKLREHDIIAFDTEFIRETTFYPCVEIIQIATDEESWLVDAQAFKDPKTLENLRPLLDIFEDRSILKIVHASQGDQECLYTTFGVVAVNTLDTAVAASLCGYGDSIGLGNLLKAALGVTIKKGHARTNWSVRPLPPQLLEYAHVDVEYLVATARKLIGELEKLGRKEWALEVSAKWEVVSLYQPDPVGMAQKLARGGRLDQRGYAALLELMKWREERVRQVNLPRRWVADDNILMDLAHVRPKDIAHLGTFRGINKGELSKSGEAILAALHRANDAKDVVLPKLPRPEIPNASEAQALELLRCYVGILADRHQIAAKHLMTAAQLLPLMRSKIEHPSDLVARGVLSEGSSRLIGDEVIAMLKGKRALSVEGSRVKIVKLDKILEQVGDPKLLE